MREEGLRRNDEFQFETFYQMLGEGNTYFGEWTTYDAVGEGVPELKKRDGVREIVSRGEKLVLDPDAEWRVDGEALVLHEEERCCPARITSRDFRGPQGLMCVGGAYTTCVTTPSSESGPFSNLRAEVALTFEHLRFRIKLSYDAVGGPLLLKTLTVCRELLHERPSEMTHEEQRMALFGPPGAKGGLYDPPPVGEGQGANYMLVDLEGGATALFPHTMEQEGENGWVFSLDWTAEKFRYQADRKVFGGDRIKNLYRLELVEVQSDKADAYRPNDGPVNMPR